MKIISLLIAIITGLLLLSTLICGYWIYSRSGDAGAVAFHMKLGIASTIMGLITVVLLIIKIRI